MIRFVVEVERNADTPDREHGGWSVSISCPVLGERRIGPRVLRRLTEGARGFPAPPGGECDPNAASHALCGATEARPIQSAYSQIIGRNPGKDGVVAFGRYLFDVLIGPEAWQAIQRATTDAGERSLELALSWAKEETDLHRLNWEMMHTGDAFLVAGYGNTAVAITRLVRETGSLEAGKLESPPKVLFVVGSELLDEQIRPAAEYLGLLRQIKSDGRAILSSILELATPKKLRERMEEFKPQVVHFVCHGNLDASGNGYLELQKDESDADGRLFASQILQQLKVDGALPPIVVLSACFSATTAAGGPTTQLWRSDQAAPLAAELVRGGIPVVLGMAGRVSDLACRLFTRRFGEAIINGDALVAATAEARRATFAEGDPPHMSVDWAFPTVFLAEGVPTDYAPIVPANDDLAARVARRITAYNIERPPVFCGRHEFFGHFDALFASEVRVLAAWVDQASGGYGRTRLLEELTMHALREGHVPVLVPTSSQEPPRTVEQLGQAVVNAIGEVRRHFKLSPAFSSQLLILNKPLESAKADQNLDANIRWELDAKSQVTTAAVRLAIQLDLASLITEARAKDPLVQAVHGQAVVLLDEVETYNDAVRPLLEQLLTGYGLGSDEEPVPVVLTFALGGPLDHVLRPYTERVQKGWLLAKQLKAFQPVEDMMAYEQVLMNPYDKLLWEDVSEFAWAVSPDATEPLMREFEDKFRKRLKGKPDKMASEVLYFVAESAAEKGYLVRATDDDVLKKVRI